MKEYKFRSWDKLSMEYFDFEDMFYEAANKITGSDYSDAKIMQYINIKDKNDKEIYEGDIVSYSYQFSKDADSDIIFKKEVVEWDEMYCGFHPFIYIETFYIKTNDLKVIGNIYENPKLLEEEKQNGTA
jgi:uncharacterized phage protein (TIGR01671 family)